MVNRLVSDEFITLKEASARYHKTVSNISYLIRYGRISKYNSKGEKTNQVGKDGVYVSVRELDTYFKKLKKRWSKSKEHLGDFKKEIDFSDLPERERTKHVHRLHPYLGKFIPQLVEYYLATFFEEGYWILDPFMGSGTTLVESMEHNINCTGIDISEFNCMISRAKVEKYEVAKLEKEINSILIRFETFCKQMNGQKRLDEFFSSEDSVDISELTNPYLKEWYFPQVYQELEYFKQLIRDYTYQNILKVILSRAARSCRLVFHFELTRQNTPILEPYVCYKHLNKVCTPLTTSLTHVRKYCIDTLRRIKEFAGLRTEAQFEIIKADSRTFKFPRKYDGIFTSPPYVGLINYHEQHRYAYELFGLPWDEDNEIGLQKRGSSKKAKEDYVKDISNVFQNLSNYLKDEARVFIVANDKYDLYPKIAELSGFKIIAEDKRPVTWKASRERSVYNESIFHFQLDL